MNISYEYFKKRANFGRPYFFVEDGPTLVDSVWPRQDDKYTIKFPLNKATQKSPIMAYEEVNTKKCEYRDSGMFHDEGGWPKEVNLMDEEAVLRYKKKLEREDNYVHAMKTLTKTIEHAILQNNAINIYQKYFEEVMGEYTVEGWVSRVKNTFRDYSKDKRRVSHLSWSPDKNLFATSYCDARFQMLSPNDSTQAYVWNVEIPNPPQSTFDSKIPIVTLEFNPTDRHVLIGGMYTGQVASYDVRKAPEHVDICPEEVGHREPVTSILWTYSKTGMDFFSAAADGVIKWWDCRFLTQVSDSIILDVTHQNNLLHAYRATCLDYDPTSPSKYMVGTETGHVIYGSRKGVSLAEKLPYHMRTHLGPIYAVQRNPAYPKFCLVVGDYSVRIWSEECRESAIMWTKSYKAQLTGGGWSKSRWSVFFVIRSDGYFDLWDILQNQKQPFVSIRLSKMCLSSMRVDEDGTFVVVGDEEGACFLLQFAESLTTCGKNDKALLSWMFDRENRREKLFESRMKEVRLATKLKTHPEEDEDALQPKVTQTTEELDQDDNQVAEKEYWEEVQKLYDTFTEAAALRRKAEDFDQEDNIADEMEEQEDEGSRLVEEEVAEEKQKAESNVAGSPSPSV